MKFRLFPTKEQQEKLKESFEQFRWYYNAIVHIYNDQTIDQKYKKDLRKLLNQHSYQQEKIGNLTFQEFIFDENRNQLPIPDWWVGRVHSRLPRGAVRKFTSSLHSALSNSKNGNNKEFHMDYKLKKDSTDYLHFEDKGYPKFIDQIKSHFWYRNGKRKIFTFQQLKDKRSLEIIYEKDTDRYFLHAPVERSFYPKDDLRNESQVKYISKGEKRIISLDPGIRKFLVGYDPSGFSIFIGDRASTKLTSLLLEDDKHKRRYIKNLINELHWKTASFLVENYDIILLPDFKVQQMIKGQRLSKIVKRLMLQFCFHQFKEKLKYKCETYGKQLLIVNESYTSCTCTKCGTINKVKGKESLECSNCGLKIDRDVAGARNILIKTLTK